MIIVKSSEKNNQTNSLKKNALQNHVNKKREKECPTKPVKKN